jgi:uncharacterized membrane protein
LERNSIDRPFITNLYNLSQIFTIGALAIGSIRSKLTAIIANPAAARALPVGSRDTIRKALR